MPGHPIRCTYEGTLRDMLVFLKPRQIKKLYYQQLSIRINELENKRQFKCSWVGSRLKEDRELVLYPNKGASVGDLLQEAMKQVTTETGKLRLLEISSFKVISVQREDTILDTMNPAGTKAFRIEEVPKDELYCTDDEVIISVAHFHKEAFSTFGIPFLLKLKHGESFANVKSRIQEKADIPDKEFEKFRFAIIVMGRAQFIEDGTYCVNVQDFKPPPSHGGNMSPRPWLGLEHMNKATKRSRYNYLEKAIKIYN